MAVSVSWLEDCQFNVVTEDKFEFTIDADGKKAPCPTEVLLSALGTCSATDVVMGLQDEGVELRQFENKLTYTLTESSPRLYESVNLHFVVKAANVTEEQVSAAANNALEKYCHVCLMLQPKIKVTHSVEILKP
ncbi:osmotically inducible protein OsmC [Photobacterium sanctipauli]|uniref:Osmotically inducible protein OsmC n=1 Tax=Photobacterium sanctipauli TaxID=1342794 RepID=A0A2T3NWE8_9GAMM|nr:OsmC family protein [Photobacterium sanctipauli]PSW20549.1 osmotically inducible protein OsmC [Photobacterium sanctipauli]